MAPKKQKSPPPWAHRHLTDLPTPQPSTSEATMTARKDRELDKAVEELANWWKHELSDEEYYPRVKRIVDICHARQPGYEQVKRFEAKFRSAGATQEHVNMVLGDLEPHWTQAILTHVAKTATSPHGIASVIRIMLAETERLHGQVIDKSSHDELIRAVNRFDPPPPVIPSLSGLQRPQLQVDVNVVKQNAEDMFMTPSSAVSSVLHKQPQPSKDTSAPAASARKPCSTPSLSHDISSDPRRSSDSSIYRLDPPRTDHQDRRERVKDGGKGHENTSREPERARFVSDGRVPERSISSGDGRALNIPIPDRPRLDRERDAAKVAREQQHLENRGRKRKVNFDDDHEDPRDGRVPTGPRSRTSEQTPFPSYPRHETKIQLPQHMINKNPEHINDVISLSCDRSYIRFNSSRPLNDRTWILDFESKLDQREAIGRTLAFGGSPTIIQAVSPPSQHFQIFVAHVPDNIHPNLHALHSIAKRFPTLNFALLLQTNPMRRLLKWVKWVVCLEAPIKSEIVNIAINQEVRTFYALPADTERCFVCSRARHSCLRCDSVEPYAMRSLEGCPQYLEYLPDIISQDIFA